MLCLASALRNKVRSIDQLVYEAATNYAISCGKDQLVYVAVTKYMFSGGNRLRSVYKIQT